MKSLFRYLLTALPNAQIKAALMPVVQATFMASVLALLLNPIVVNAASLQSLVSRNQVSLNETIQLVVELDQQADTQALDTRLLTPDFDVLGVSPQNNSSVTIINGQTTQKVSTKWVVTLAPKREGLLTVPAFTIAGAQSSPITITVKNNRAANGQNTSPLTASALISKLEVYPGEQLLLTVELSASSDVSNLNASSLEIQNADYELLNQENFSRVDNGIARQMVELKYIVFAKDTGTLKIPSLTFTGIQGGSRSFFGQRGKQVVARTKPHDVTVIPKPAASGSWFPASKVDINATWSGDISTLTVGTPITRTITITAQDQRAEAIPPISTASRTGSNFSSYKDQPQLTTEKTRGGLRGVRIESEAIVPSIAGEFTLPAVTVDWFNTQTKEWQQSTLPAETLTAKGAAQLPSVKQPQFDTNQSPSQTQNATASVQAIYNRAWVWQIVSLLLLSLCVYQWFFLGSKNRDNEKLTTESKKTQSETQAWKQLKQSLSSGNPANVRQNLITWYGEAFPNEALITLDEIAEKIEGDTDDSAIHRALGHLQVHLYGESKESVSGQLKDLENILTSYRSQQKKGSLKNARRQTKIGRLQPLYPEV